MKKLSFSIHIRWICLLISSLLTANYVQAGSGEQSYAQTKRLTLSMSNITLEQLFETIKAQSDFSFSIRSSDINLNEKITIDVKNQKITEILNQVLNSQQAVYEIRDRHIIIYKPSPEMKKSETARQEISVSGTVTDGTGEPIPGANVIIKGTTTGLVTGIDGKYSIHVPDTRSILIFSFVGYTTKEEEVGDRRIIDVTLIEGQEIEEVVVTALGIKREEKALGYAVQNVNSKELTTVKTVDVATKLTGKVAGLNVQNSTEFNEAPTMLLRGETPLLVVDGIPYQNITLRDIASDDIESITVLKGATASALYGQRGQSGAIMVTTKRGYKGSGLEVEVNSSAMFTAGFLARPEVQTSYSSGGSGKYGIGDYVWGDKLDIGRTSKMYNPYTYEWEETELVSKGKKNLQHFMQSSYVLNNNINISQQGENGGFRTSLTYVYNRGQYPNTVLNKVTATVSGNMKRGNFDMEAGMTYNKRFYPSNLGMGYGGTGFLYNLVVWQGTEFDIRDYRDYWVAGKEDYQQNWMDTQWYNNPWFLAYEAKNSGDYDITNGFITANYQIFPWLKATLRSGLDAYSEKKEYIRPISTVGASKGSYSKYRNAGYSWNNDFLLLFDQRSGSFGIDGFVGGTIYYTQNDNMTMSTENGLTVPGFYSIYASVDPAKTEQGGSKRQVNSLFAKATLSWKSIFFLDITGRNDWSSTLKSGENSYFYPSVAGSWVINETFLLPKVISLLKLRASWTQSKEAPGEYSVNSPYGISTNMWDGLNGAYYPAPVKIGDKTYYNIIRDANILPQSTRTYEFGLGSNFWANRLRFDIAYYNKLYYDKIIPADVSDASGFSYIYLNIDEEIVRKGVEITIGATPVHTGNWRWDVTANWSWDRRYYHKIDPNYSEDSPWVAKGNRYDWIKLNDWERAPDGQLILNSGKVTASKYETLFGYSSPDWVWGLGNSISWKQLTLGFSFDGRVGGMLFNTTNQAMWNSGSHIESDNQYRYDQVVNGLKNYTGEGVMVVSGDVQRDKYGNITEDTRVFAPNNVVTTYEEYIKAANPYIGTQRSQNFFKQTFIKLRELSLSYELSKPLAGKIGMKGVSVGIIGQNLLLWTKEFKYSDPDKAQENMNAPSIRYIGGNIKFNF